jgi:hypothetical protein
MAIRSVPLDPAEVSLGGNVAPTKIQVVGGKTQNTPAAGNFSHVQGSEARTAGPVTSAFVTLGATPKPGNLVCVAIAAFGGTGIILSSVEDSNGNVYTITPGSPSNVNESTALDIWLAYLLSAPANAAAKITATFVSSVTTDVVVWADEFSVPVGTQAAFDNDAVGSGATSSSITGTNFAAGVPTITPTNSNSLLYSALGPSGAVSSVNAPWTLGIIDGSSGAANAYILSAGSSVALAYVLGGPSSFNSMAAAFYLMNPSSSIYSGVSLGPFGRSVIVEGASGSGVVPVPVVVKSNTPVNLVAIAGFPVAVGVSGLLQVGIVGNIGVALDAVITAGTAPANGLMTLAVNRTTAPSLTTGQSVGLQCDYAGDLFVKPYRHSKTVAATGNIASATPANIIGSQGAGIFADLSAIVLTLREGATANIFFAVLISDGTASYRFNFLSQDVLTQTPSAPIAINFDPPIPASSAAVAWTIALSSATDTPSVDYICNFVLQKAS